MWSATELNAKDARLGQVCGFLPLFAISEKGDLMRSKVQNDPTGTRRLPFQRRDCRRFCSRKTNLVNVLIGLVDVTTPGWVLAHGLA